MATLLADSVTTEEWAERAGSLASVIEQYRDQSEEQRHMAQPMFEAIAGTGIIDMLVPRAFGGPQAAPSAQLRVIEELSRHSGSAGWNVMIWTGTGLFADYLPEAAAREM